MRPELSPQQKEAVQCDAARVYVEAGPGSGKTTVLAHRVQHLVRNGVPPERILALTFTRTAAARLRTMLGWLGPDVATFHGFAARYSVGSDMSIATESETDAAIDSLYRGPNRLSPSNRIPISQLRRDIAYYEATGDVPEDNGVAIDTVRHRLESIGRIPMFDLIPDLFNAKDAIIPDVPYYDHVLVDEAQDCTMLESEMANQLALRGIYAVGDPSQAIMGWRFGNGFAIDSPTIKRLDVSYRFGSMIAAYANEVQRWRSSPLLVDGIGSRGFVLAIDTPFFKKHINECPKTDEARSRVILCRTNVQCEMVAARSEGVVVHVKRDPTTILDSEADHFADVFHVGLVAVSTIHAAKGLEFDDVYVLADEDWPRREMSDEERRVLFVAVTRARSILGVDQRISRLIRGEA